MDFIAKSRMRTPCKFCPPPPGHQDYGRTQSRQNDPLYVAHFGSPFIATLSETTDDYPLLQRYQRIALLGPPHHRVGFPILVEDGAAKILRLLIREAER